MTRPAKKDYERRLVSRFLEGHIPYNALEESERPDFRVRRADGDIALEVTGYHAQRPEGGSGVPRVAVEARWWRELWPRVDLERKARPKLEDVQVRFGFDDSKLRRTAQCELDV